MVGLTGLDESVKSGPVHPKEAVDLFFEYPIDKNTGIFGIVDVLRRHEASDRTLHEAVDDVVFGPEVVFRFRDLRKATGIEYEDVNAIIRVSSSRIDITPVSQNVALDFNLLSETVQACLKFEKVPEYVREFHETNLTYVKERENENE